jgi:hypothetical protein
MYRVLKNNNLGDFKADNYWSSTYSTSGMGLLYSFYINFKDGTREHKWQTVEYYVRPIRQF